MRNIYQDNILIAVQSKYPGILNEFKNTFYPTTEKFPNLKLYELTDERFGAKVINELIRENYNSFNFFGVFNDDLWFADGWLEDTLSQMSEKKQRNVLAVSSGYAETRFKDNFEKAVESSKNETGFVPFLYGANAIFHKSIFKKVGMYDENIKWSVDDLDWAWRIYINGYISMTLKRVKVGHFLGKTRQEDSEKWRLNLDKGKFYFFDKHGYQSYRNIRNQYKIHHQYFKQFKLL